MISMISIYCLVCDCMLRTTTTPLWFYWSKYIGTFGKIEKTNETMRSQLSQVKKFKKCMEFITEFTWFCYLQRSRLCAPATGSTHTNKWNRHDSLRMAPDTRWYVFSKELSKKKILGLDMTHWIMTPTWSISWPPNQHRGRNEGKDRTGRPRPGHISRGK